MVIEQIRVKGLTEDERQGLLVGYDSVTGRPSIWELSPYSLDSILKEIRFYRMSWEDEGNEDKDRIDLLEERIENLVVMGAEIQWALNECLEDWGHIGGFMVNNNTDGSSWLLVSGRYIPSQSLFNVLASYLAGDQGYDSLIGYVGGGGYLRPGGSIPIRGGI